MRPRRAAKLARVGLTIRSRFGDADLSAPPTISEGALAATFDWAVELQGPPWRDGLLRTGLRTALGATTMNLFMGADKV
jgi:hypothetical protein